MFGFGKRRCKECGTELSDMEDVRDRVDDLMRNSEYAAEPLENICARCRVLLAKGSPSLQSNLHVIEARRIEAEEAAAVAVPDTEPGPVADQPEEPTQEQSEYVGGGGYKTEEELFQEQTDGYRQSRSAYPQSTATMVLDWLVNTKNGRNVLGVGFVLLMILFNLFDSDENNAPPLSREEPYEVAEQTEITETNSPDAPLPLPTAPEPQPLPPIAPATNPGSWVTTNDYPSRALREEREGTTAFRLDVGVDGKVTACTVTASSGHGDLDAATCKALMRRARFEPITDGGGPASWTSRVRWTIPK
ncbi:MAG TPA: energy transducer TonB [Sphingorhabdus sp.]|nr:energy transducer TonB [Sphingorhabdus sp.]